MAATEPKSTRERKRELALTLSASRSRLITSGRTLRRRLSPARAARSFTRRHPLRLFGATAAGVAVLTVLLRPRKRRRKPPESLPRRLLGWVIAVTKPAARYWILKQTKTYMEAKDVAPETDSLLGP